MFNATLRTSYSTAITQESTRAVTLDLVAIHRACSAMFARSHHTRIETAVMNYVELRNGLARIPKVVVYIVDDEVLDGSEKASSGTQYCITTSITRFWGWKIIASEFIKREIRWRSDVNRLMVHLKAAKFVKFALTCLFLVFYNLAGFMPTLTKNDLAYCD